MVSRSILNLLFVLFGILCLLLLPLGCGSGDSSFDWSVTPDRVTVAPGGTATYNIQINRKVNINSAVALRVEGVPATATATFNPQNVPDTANTSALTVQTTSNTPVGTYTLKVFAVEAGQSEQEKDVLLIVETSQGEQDFSLEVDPEAFTYPNIEAGKTFTYFVRPLNNFQGMVTTTVTGLSDDLVMSQGPTPSQVNIGPTGGAGGTFVIRVQPHPPVPSPVDITVTSVSGNLTHSRIIRITIPQ